MNSTERLTAFALRDAFEQAFKNDPAKAHPVILPPALYDRAKAEGFVMTGYVKSAPMPVGNEPLYVNEHLQGPKRFPRGPIRKHLRDDATQGCGGHTCMRGKGGHCTACPDEK